MMLPRLHIDLAKLRHNGEKLCQMAKQAGLSDLAFVTKSFCAHPDTRRWSTAMQQRDANS